jgi:hypothetical protein
MVDAEMSKQEAQDRADVELCGNRCFWCLEFSAVHLPSKCPKREMPDMSENWTKGMRKIKCACLQPRGDGIYTIDPRWKGESDKGADKATIALMFEVMGEGLRQLPDGFEGERAWNGGSSRWSGGSRIILSVISTNTAMGGTVCVWLGFHSRDPPPRPPFLIYISFEIVPDFIEISRL